MADYRILKSPLGQKIYEIYAKNLPIIDYHNHLCVNDIFCDRVFENITQLWITTDPYKHRAMRILGIPEKYITGEAGDYEKFEKWYGCLPRLAGNALYDWSCMEFKTIFDMDLEPFTAPALQIYEQVNEKLKNLSAKKLLAKFNIEYSAPCAVLTDNLDIFAQLQGIKPSLRADTVVSINPDFVQQLSACTGIQILSLRDFEHAVEKRVVQFKEIGCRFADHALDHGFAYVCDDGNNPMRFEKLLSGQTLASQDKRCLESYILRFLGGLYAKHGMTMQLHIGAKRTTSTRLRKVAGPTGGYAAIGNTVDVGALTSLLDDIEQAGGLPKTILFTLNPADNAVMSILSGSYSADGVESIVTQGPAWWWCDHAQGMRQMLEHMSVYSVLSTFVGMTTDSRSLMSFVRHDYFRQILCQWIAEKVEAGYLPQNEEILGDLITRMCYQNAKKLLER